MALVDQRVIARRFSLVKRLGAGSFGEIYQGDDRLRGHKVALKLESIIKAKQVHALQLEHEARVYRLLAGGAGIPAVHWYGTETEYNVMVMDLLGPSLEDRLNACNRKMTLKTVLLLGDQMICRLQYIHSKGYVHRDIKPDNFVMGLGEKSNQLNMIDFGLAKRYIDPRTKKHIPFRQGRHLTGTARYASVNAHTGCELSRRDDLESVAYVLVYLIKGILPWQGLKAGTKQQRYDQIMQKKKVTTPEELCQGLPVEFCILAKHAKELKFEQKPEYDYIRTIFRGLFVRCGFQHDYKYDWSK